MIFFDSDIAMSMKINVKFHNTIMLFVTALIISVAMKMIGALLIDTLVILPVVCANKSAKGLKDLFIKSSLTGFIISFTGLVFLLFGLDYGYVPLAREVGIKIAGLPYSYIILPIGFILGFVMTKVEPSVKVLISDIDHETNGAIPKKLMENTN